MTAYAEDQIEFSVLSLVRDPLPDYTEQLARNIRGLRNIRRHLNESQLDDIKAVLGTHDFDDVMLGADPAVGLTEERLMAVEAPMSESSIGNDDHPQEYVRLASSQRGIKISILEEMESRRNEEASAELRRHDCASAVEFWARTLARRGVIKELLS